METVQCAKSTDFESEIRLLVKKAELCDDDTETLMKSFEEIIEYLINHREMITGNISRMSLVTELAQYLMINNAYEITVIAVIYDIISREGGLKMCQTIARFNDMVNDLVKDRDKLVEISQNIDNSPGNKHIDNTPTEELSEENDLQDYDWEIVEAVFTELNKKHV